jgi:hypothetical protein
MRIPEYVPGGEFITSRLPQELDVSPEADGLPVYLFLPFGFQFDPTQLAEVLPLSEARARVNGAGGWVVPLLSDKGEPYRFNGNTPGIVPASAQVNTEALIVPGHPDYSYDQWCGVCSGCNGCGGNSRRLVPAVHRSGQPRRHSLGEAGAADNRRRAGAIIAEARAGTSNSK